MNAGHTGPVFRISRLEPYGEEDYGVEVHYHPIRVQSTSLKHGVNEGVKKGHFKLFICMAGEIVGFVHGNREAQILPCGDNEYEIAWKLCPYETITDLELKLDTFDIQYDLSDCQTASAALDRMQKKSGSPRYEP